MDIFQILLVLCNFHLLVDGVVHGLNRIKRSLHRVRQQSQNGVRDSRLLNRLLGGLLRILLHAIEALVGGLGILVELLQQVLGQCQFHTLTRGDQVNQAIGQLIGTKRYVLSPLL